MSHVRVVPDALRQYGSDSAAISAGIAQTAAIDQAATVATVVPVFGLIGQEFLISYAYAQGNHLSSLAELAGVWAGTAVTAHEAAATYEGSDAGSAAEFTRGDRQ